MTTQQKPLKPLPTPSRENKPFWDGLKQHEFRLQLCKACGSYRWLPKPACPNCLSEDTEWVKASGEGTLWTYSTVYRAGPAFADDIPFITAIVELKEKPLKCLVLSWLVNCKLEDVYVGMPVKVAFEAIPNEDITLYKFVPA
ncbi:MAG: Zn-ribbon domain-containing OB-fold protein [Chloroflexi bacterium]|nr:Zn-ribbon domain-containing OB-fold protein [Chloroflexota bacterium]